MAGQSHVQCLSQADGDAWVRMIKVLMLTWYLAAATQGLGRVKRTVVWPDGSGMGVFLAVAFPVDLPDYELSLSYNFEANYLLPDNITELEYPVITQVRKERDLSRKKVYSLLEERLQSEGLLGRSCLLRTICETAATPIRGYNGLMGDLLHIIFTPSSSQQEILPQEYSEAETAGEGGRENCLKVYGQCPVDLYSLFSIWENELFQTRV